MRRFRHRQPGSLQRDEERGRPRRVQDSVAALGGAGVLWYLRGQAIDDLDKGCRGSVCPESLRSTQNKGEAYSLWAPITAGVGVAAVGVAALDWWLGSRRAPAKDRGVSWSVVPVAGGAGVGGSF